jgi:NADH:ubiquinone oxidoreductase subunit 6 (subunit J)
MELLFFFSAVVALIGTLILITQKNAVYALLGLLIAFAASAGVFVALDAPFIAVSQILIYAGALAVLFLFVLMFTDTRTPGDLVLPKAVGARPVFDPRGSVPAPQKKKKDKEQFELPAPLQAALDSVQLPKPMALIISLAFFVCFAAAIWRLPPHLSSFGELPAEYSTGLTKVDSATGETVMRTVEYGSTGAVSFTIFEGFPLAFEVVSLVLFVALIGAVLLARRHLVPQRRERDHA